MVTLRHPAAYFLAITTFEVTYPQRQDIIEKFDSRWTEPGNIVTNGPFRLTSWKHENEIELSANPDLFPRQADDGKSDACTWSMKEPRR